MPIVDIQTLPDPALVQRPRSPGPATQATKADVRSAGRNSLIVSAGIFLSSCAGLIRESFITRYLGTGNAADSFKAALRIPNMLQNLMGEGVLSASFIPAYSRLRGEGNDEEAKRLAGAIAGLLIVTTGVLSLVGFLFAEQITRVLVPGYTGGPRFDLTVKLTRIMFPGIGFLVLSAWCLGVLNSHRKFFLSYVAPVLWNAAQIIALVSVGISTTDKPDMATALAWGVLIGGLLQLLLQLGPVIRLLGGVKLSLDVGRESVQHVLRRFGPVVVGKGVVQIMAFVDLWLASFLAVGAVSTLSYTLPIYLLPIGMFGLGVAAAELPDLSQVEVYDPDTRRLFRRRLEGGMARIAFYVFPIASMYIVAGDVIARVIYEHGQFGADDSRGMWIALAIFALGLPATTASRLLQNGLYALDETRTPARLAIIRVAVATVIAMAFMFPLDRLTIGAGGIEGWGDIWALGPLDQSTRSSNELVHLGIVALAIGATVGAWVEYRMLAQAVAWRIGRSRMAGRWLNPIAASCAVASLVAYGMLTMARDLPSVLTAVVVFAPAGLAYLGMTRWLQVPEGIATVERIGAVAARVTGRGS